MVSPLLGRFLVSFNLQSAVCGLQSAVFGLQSAVCSLRSAVCSLQPANVIHRFQGSLPRLYTICILHQNLPSWTALVQSNTPTFKLYLRIMRFLGLWLVYNDLIRFLSLILLDCVFISKIKRSLYEWSDRPLKTDRSIIIYNNPQMSCGAIGKQN